MRPSRRAVRRLSGRPTRVRTNVPTVRSFRSCAAEAQQASHGRWIFFIHHC